ncbi:MAG TPA: class I SAM-dependent methyltransferase [Solirubrobacterales bacterium]|nr:class I SAM-dependent methyltransferase [Solirubrobacterales bacterium]
MGGEIPIPPFHLSARMMHGADLENARAEYLERGEQTREAIERALPGDWSWARKSVLDFGCGAGRAIRHLVPLAPECDLWGSDIDAQCIEWDKRHLSPPASFVVNEEVPPLPFPAGRFDLVYALSVFTHITTHWPAWLLELDRILAPGGRLIVTIMSEGMCKAVSGEAWDEKNIGMNVYEAGQAWSFGGPMVLHSPWWIEEHWGRLFEIERLLPRGFHGDTVGPGQDDQGVVVLRKASRTATAEDLERIDPGEAREAPALYHDLLHLRAEVASLRAQIKSSPDPISGREGLAAVGTAVKRRLRR